MTRCVCVVAIAAFLGGLACILWSEILVHHRHRRRPFPIDAHKNNTPAECCWVDLRIEWQLREAPKLCARCTTNDALSNVLRAEGKWHDCDDLLVLLRGHPPEGGGLFVDVGANLGYFSLMAAAMGCRVIAFEPMERNVARFLASIARNRAAITLYQNAVAHQAGRVVALRPTHAATNYGNGQIITSGEESTEDATTVRLDDVGITGTIDLLKIDVEGFELSVLDGARRLLCAGAIRRVVLEWSDATRANPECPAREGLRRLVAVGYTLSDIVPDAPPLSPDDPLLPPNLLLTLRTPSCI